MMSKVFTAEEFIAKLKWLANEIPTVYHSGKGWSTRNKDGKWQFDCVLSVKSILWGFRADKSKTMGGTVYKSNGVADFTCNNALDLCTDVSQNFAHLTPGEYLCMKGTKYNHTGVYLGNNKVFECTTGWGTKKCMISDIDSKGTRSYKGVKNLKWTYHGKLKYIDYSGQPKPMNQTAILQSKMNEQWNCKLDVDGSFGPKTKAQCIKHQLTYRCKAPIMIKWLQTRLTELGISVGKSGIDGYFGNDTKKAVIAFQKKKHLNPDAIVGQYTYKALVE